MSNASPYPTDATEKPSDSVQKPVTKAGMMIWGFTDPAKRQSPFDSSYSHPYVQVLATYDEGRIGERYKFYGMPKGSIEAGESPLAGALRETEEETGISFERLMGKENLAKFLSGERLENLDTGYKGVRIIRADPTISIDHTYLSGRGREHRTAYYAIELEGIEHLCPHLRRMHECESEKNDTVNITARVHYANSNLPKFEELLEIMRTGKVPTAHSTSWMGKKEQKIIENPALPEIERNWVKAGKAKVDNINNWREFCNKIDFEDSKKIDSDVNRIKSYLMERGVINDSGPVLKMDAHDTPLNFYQEGAEILPLDVFLWRSLNVAGLYPEFARARWGEYEGKKRPNASETERMASAQIAPVYQFFKDIAPMQLAAATIEDPDKKQKEGNKPPLLSTRGKTGVEVFVDPAVKTPEWCAKISASRTTPPSADAAQTAR